MKRLLLTLAAGAMLAGAPAFAQTPSAKSTVNSANKATKADQTFVRKATVANMTEVAMGNVALQRTQNAAIRQHAQMMVSDHETAQRQLEQTAGVGAANHALDTKHEKMVSKLQKAKPEQFDREYANTQLKAHDEAIKLHQKAVKGGSSNSAPIQQLATTMLPKLQEHRAMTISVGQQVGASKVSS